MNHPPPQTFFLDHQDPSAALAQPAIRALAAQGWKPVGFIPVTRPDSPGVDLFMVLWPPGPEVKAASRRDLLVQISSVATPVLVLALIFAVLFGS